jgi:hypothetical protein
MNYATYKRVRAENPGIGAKRAVESLRYVATPVLDLDWRSAGAEDRARFTHSGAEIVARWIPDYDSDSATRPRATDSPASGIRNPDCVVTHEDDGFHLHHSQCHHSGRVCLSAPRYLELESGETVSNLADFYRKHGMSRAVARETAESDLAKWARQESETNYFSCVVTAYVNGTKLGESSLYGIGESDDYDAAIAYRAEIVSELLSDAIDNAQHNLESLRTAHIGDAS